MSRILVTGGGGFLGSEIVDQLLKKGHSVRVVGRSAYPWLEEKGVDCFRADLSILEEASPAFHDMDAVFHVAAKPGIFGPYNDFYKANVTATENVIQLCRENQVPHLIHTSSPSVVFDGSDLEGVDESYPIPEEFHAPYPETKAIAEKKVLSANSEGLSTTALRPHLIWGPGDNHLIPRFLQRASKRQLKIIGSGTKLVDTIYVEDAARAHLLAYEELLGDKKNAGKAYFLSQNEPVPIFQWMNRFIEAAGMPRVTSHIPTSLAYFAGFLMEGFYNLTGRTDEPRMTRFLAGELATAHYFDISASNRDFGYQPKYTMEEAYEITFQSEYFKKQVERYGSN